MIVNFLNWLTDMDWGWWPLLKHRPEKHEYIDSKVLFKITPMFGTVTGLLFMFITNTVNDLMYASICMLAGWVLFFVGYRVTFSVAWNIRADSLKNNNDIA